MTDATWKVRPTTWKVQLAIRDHLSNSLKQCWPKRSEQGKCDARVNTHPKFGWFNTFLKTCHWRKLLKGDVLYTAGRKRTKNSLKIFFKDALDTRWWITKEARSTELAITNFTFNERKWHNCFIESSTYKISLIIMVFCRMIANGKKTISWPLERTLKVSFCNLRSRISISIQNLQFILKFWR